VQPKYYFICNGPMTHAALVDVKKTKDNWLVLDQPDFERNYTTKTYAIPKQDVIWIQL
jgi:hypothetical protein